jgi:hypothetical protein
VSPRRARRWTATLLALGLAASIPALELELSLERGPAYAQERQLPIGRTLLTPHLAAWLEDGTGMFVKTFQVSLRQGKQDFWVGNRPHPLPVWQSRHGAEPIVDAIGGASPAAKAPLPLVWRTRTDKAPASGLVLWLEVNIGFDHNPAWPDDGKELWGQPGVLYRLALPDGPKAGARYSLQAIGRADGAKGDWTPSLAGLTTALDLISRAELRIIRE